MSAAHAAVVARTPTPPPGTARGRWLRRWTGAGVFVSGLGIGASQLWGAIGITVF